MFCEVFGFMPVLFTYLKTTSRSRASQRNLNVVSRPHLSGTTLTTDLHGHTLHRVKNRPHRHKDRNPVLQTTAAHTDAYRKTRRLRCADMSKWCITVLTRPTPQCNTKKRMSLSEGKLNLEQTLTKTFASKTHLHTLHAPKPVTLPITLNTFSNVL